MIGLVMRWAIAFSLGLWVAGCASRGSDTDSTLATGEGGSPAVERSMSGRVQSGSTGIANATVALYSAGTSGSAASLLARTTTDARGEFSVTVACPADTAALIYATASGGATSGASGSDNTAIALLAVLGNCQSAADAIVVNELTTVAAAYALDAFIGSGGVSGNSVGLTNAMATAALLADPGSGAPAATLPAGSVCATDPATPNCEVKAKLAALANALSSCVESNASSSPSCAALLACATPDASVSNPGDCTAPPAGELPAGVTAPGDTLDAILSIARHPGTVAVSALYALAAERSTYSEELAAAPSDWTLALNFSGGGLSEPAGLALDAVGNVWIADYNDAVTELSPTGGALSPAGGFTGGGLEESFGIAVDPQGHIWICNQQSEGSVNGGLGSVTELASDGSVLSSPAGIMGGGLDFPIAVLPDEAGNIWVANYGDSTLTELSASDGAMSPSSGYSGGGLSFPVGLALDASGDVWVANQGANQVSEFSATGAALSPSGGFAGAGLEVPQGIAVDQAHHVWVTNDYGNSVSELTSEGAPLSSPSGYLGGGLNAPGGIAIDGAGTVWVANYQGASITALEGASGASPGAPLSPASGFVSASLQQPFALAIDASGDLWVTNFGNDSVTEFVGIAAPVKTPTIGVPQAP